MRRYLHVLHYPTFGGPHGQALRLAPVLAEAGWETVVLLPEERGNAAELLRGAGIRVIEAPLRRLRATVDPRTHLATLGALPGDVARIRRLVRSLDAEIVVVSGLANPHGALAGRRAGIPVVWQLLDTRLPPPTRRVLMRAVDGLADAVMTSGRRVAELHLGNRRRSYDVVVYFPPVDTERLTAARRERSAARARLGLDPRDVVVGTIGNLTPPKGYISFVRSAALLVRDVPHVRFVILGATAPTHRAYADEVRRLADALGVDLLVVDPGVRAAELAASFDVFMLTSENEGLPTVLGEAMALALPVVATAVGSVSEAVEDEVTGLLVRPGDAAAASAAVLRLLHDEELAGRLGEKGARRASALFGVSVCANAYLRAFAAATTHRELRRRRPRAGARA
jgi:glycosyltransferase involved in cell wall biosynthesis